MRSCVSACAQFHVLKLSCSDSKHAVRQEFSNQLTKHWPEIYIKRYKCCITDKFSLLYKQENSFKSLKQKYQNGMSFKDI